jgi:lipopolysaccharide/colanic/teichoic acid biosynthesis glycosyltransferase
LLTQDELITARDKLNVFDVRPGITGLAQINSIDMSTPAKLAKTDAKMLATLEISSYFGYLLSTLFGRGSGDAAQ